jgi:hypothetical protein
VRLLWRFEPPLLVIKIIIVAFVPPNVKRFETRLTAIRFTFVASVETRNTTFGDFFPLRPFVSPNVVILIASHGDLIPYCLSFTTILSVEVAV